MNNDKPMGKYELRQRIIEAFDNIIAEDNKELQLQLEFQQQYHAGYREGVRKLKSELIKCLIWENKEKNNVDNAS